MNDSYSKVSKIFNIICEIDFRGLVIMAFSLICLGDSVNFHCIHQKLFFFIQKYSIIAIVYCVDFNVQFVCHENIIFYWKTNNATIISLSICKIDFNDLGNMAFFPLSASLILIIFTVY